LIENFKKVQQLPTGLSAYHHLNKNAVKRFTITKSDGGELWMEIIDWLFLAMALLALVPASILTRQFRRSGVLDYLILAAIFALPAAALLCLLPADPAKENLDPEDLVFGQLHQIFYNSFLFLWFLHAVRMRWERAPRIFWYTGVIWVSILTFLIMFWEPITEPQRAVVLFWDVPNRYYSEIHAGAGLVTKGGVVLYSGEHNLLRSFFAIFIYSLTLYAYSTVKPAYASKRIIFARRLWLFVWFLALTYSILSLPWFHFISWAQINVLALVALGIVAYIGIRLPEGLLISQFQILRALDLYEQVQELTTEQAIKEFGMPSLVKYLQSIPAEVLAIKT
jgi:hypothetical protein